jgi:glycosyltransferase involved in cell wall biosynthesis
MKKEIDKLVKQKKAPFSERLIALGLLIIVIPLLFFLEIFDFFFKKHDITFIYHGTAGFYDNDLRIFHELGYTVHEIQYKNFLDYIRIFNSVRKTDVSMSWFANRWSVVQIISAKLFRKPTIVIAGGYDSANVKEMVNGKLFKYGNMTHPIYKWFSWFSFKYADKVLSVSDSTKREVLKICKPKNIEVVFNCIKSEFER